MNNLQRNNLCGRSVIKFRRWLKKGYAIFAGSGREIVVGVLGVRMCRMAMLKSGLKSSISLLEAVAVLGATDEEEDTREAEATAMMANMEMLCPVVCASAKYRASYIREGEARTTIIIR